MTALEPGDTTDSNTPKSLSNEPRGARRKRRTRQKLLNAALRLMAEKGLEGVAINQITEQADVGFGTFYNHFPSKEAIYEALQEEVFGRFGDAVDAQLATLQDPAEKISVALRHTIQRSKQNPDWAKFLIREGFSVKALTSGLGMRLARDIILGVHSGRFKEEDIELQVLSIGATILACMNIQVGLADPASDHATLFSHLQEAPQDIGERLVKHVLISLGLPSDEAITVSCVPLPASIEEETLDI